jgi:hypothetical protein
MNNMQSEQGFSVYRLRWVGYGLLILSLLDTIAVLTPPQFLNHVWELQTIGALVTGTGAAVRIGTDFLW